MSSFQKQILERDKERNSAPFQNKNINRERSGRAISFLIPGYTRRQLGGEDTVPEEADEIRVKF